MSENKYKYLIALKLEQEDIEHHHHDIPIEKMKEYVEYAGYKTKLITEEEAKQMSLPDKKHMEEQVPKLETKGETTTTETKHKNCVHQTTVYSHIPPESDNEETRKVVNSLVQMVNQILNKDH